LLLSMRVAVGGPIMFWWKYELFS